MAWCHLAPSHYLSQCWPRSMLPYGGTRPQWVNDRCRYLHCSYPQRYHNLVISHWNILHINHLMQKRHNSRALALELYLFCIKPSIYFTDIINSDLIPPVFSKKVLVFTAPPACWPTMWSVSSSRGGTRSPTCQVNIKSYCSRINPAP